MNLIKIIFVLIGMVAFCMPTFAFDNVYEPESETAVSYSTYSVFGGKLETTVVKYATANPQNDEYWLRVSQSDNKEKILYYMTITIDGVNYPLRAMEPKYYQAVAATSAIDHPSGGGMLGYVDTARTDFRYFPLSKDIVAKLLTAKNLSVTYNRVKRINITFDVADNVLKGIQANLQPEFVDFKNYWKPNIGNN